MSTGNMNKTTDSGLDPTMDAEYRRAMIERARPELVHLQFAQRGTVIRVPNRTGKVCEWKLWANLEPAEELTEGVTPPGKKLSMSKVSATLKQFGDYTLISDVASLTSLDPILLDAAELFGEQIGDTFDLEAREVLNAGTSVHRVGGHLTRDGITSSNIVTTPEIKKAIRTLERNKAKRFENGLYVGFVHPDVKFDVSNDSDFKEWGKYAVDAQGRIVGYVLGEYCGVLWVQSTNAKIFSAEGAEGIDVYSTLILGRNAFGTAKWTEVEFYYTPPGAGDDYLRQREAAGWKGDNVTKILQQIFMVRIESAATAA